MYEEIFQWDQKLHVVDFKIQTSKGESELKRLCATTGGTYKQVRSFGEVRFRSQLLAENCLYTVQC